MTEFSSLCQEISVLTCVRDTIAYLIYTLIKNMKFDWNIFMESIPGSQKQAHVLSMSQSCRSTPLCNNIWKISITSWTVDAMRREYDFKLSLFDVIEPLDAKHAEKSDQFVSHFRITLV